MSYGQGRRDEAFRPGALVAAPVARRRAEGFPDRHFFAKIPSSVENFYTTSRGEDESCASAVSSVRPYSPVA
jgi:hypothetical protein